MCPGCQSHGRGRGGQRRTIRISRMPSESLRLGAVRDEAVVDVERDWRGGCRGRPTAARDRSPIAASQQIVGDAGALVRGPHVDRVQLGGMGASSSRDGPAIAMPTISPSVLGEQVVGIAGLDLLATPARDLGHIHLGEPFRHPRGPRTPRASRPGGSRQRPRRHRGLPCAPWRVVIVLPPSGRPSGEVGEPIGRPRFHRPARCAGSRLDARRSPATHGHRPGIHCPAPAWACSSSAIWCHRGPGGVGDRSSAAVPRAVTEAVDQHGGVRTGALADVRGRLLGVGVLPVATIRCGNTWHCASPTLTTVCGFWASAEVGRVGDRAVDQLRSVCRGPR